MLYIAFLLSLVLPPLQTYASKGPPHIIVLLADDLGWGNVGYHNNLVLTPELDALAADGLKLKRHYTYKYCSPTRSSFLSGRLPIHVNQENRQVTAPGGGIDLRMTLFPKLLKRAGYMTHHVGKLHVGMSSTDHLMVNRGFDSSFGFLGGAEDHNTQIQHGGVDLWDSTKPAWGQNGTTYGDYMYLNKSMEILAAHDKRKPLFLFHSMQVVHDPNEAPKIFLDRYPKDMNSKDRRFMYGMASVMSSVVGNITDALKANGMWDDAFILFSGDNGGASGVNSKSGNNWPLRGGKHSDFEGGVRATAFVTGGVLPESRRGKELNGYIHIADWYTTFLELAGVKHLHHDGAAVPGVDSLNMWPLLSGSNETSPRTVIPLSSREYGGGLISGNYKLVVGDQDGLGFHQWQTFPDGTKPENDPGCPDGCLFDIINDPEEHHDLSETRPDIKSELEKMMDSYTTYQSECNGNPIPEKKKVKLAYNEAKHANRGFWGPYNMCQLA